MAKRLDGYVVRISFVNGTEPRRILIGVRPFEEAHEQFLKWCDYYKKKHGGVEKIELKHGNKIHRVMRNFPIVAPGERYTVVRHFYESHPDEPWLVVSPNGYRILRSYRFIGDAMKYADALNNKLGFDKSHIIEYT